MISLLLSSTIASLLVVGCYYDWKTRHVSNLITGSIIALSVPLIWLNIPHIGIIHVVYGVTTLIGLGMADTKVLLPVSLSYPLTSLFIFLIIFGIIGFAYILITKKKNDVPAFIPITVGYVAVMLFA